MKKTRWVAPKDDDHDYNPETDELIEQRLEESQEPPEEDIQDADGR